MKTKYKYLIISEAKRLCKELNPNITDTQFICFMTELIQVIDKAAEDNKKETK